MRRILATSMLAAIAAVTLPSAATAGGSFLHPRERSYAWGERAIASERYSGPVPRYLGRPDVGTVAAGPFYAYLVPEGRFLRAGKPIPPSAVPLGRIRFHQLPPNSYCCLAYLRFTVPQVPPGEYWIDYCNDPCTVTDIGFSAGSLLIGSTPLEARLLERLERARFRMTGLRRDARVHEGLRDRFRAAKAELEELERELETARAQQDVVMPAPVVEGRTTSPWIVAAWTALGLLLGALTSWLLVRRRTRRRIVPVPPRLEGDPGTTSEVAVSPREEDVVGTAAPRS